MNSCVRTLTSSDGTAIEGGCDHPTQSSLSSLSSSSSSSSPSAAIADHLNSTIERTKHARRTALRDLLMGSRSYDDNNNDNGFRGDGYNDAAVTKAFVSSGEYTQYVI